MRGFLRFILVLLAVLVIAWIGAWWYLEGRLVVGFRQMEAQLRANGWQVTHGAVTRGNSPLVARFGVADLKLVPPANGAMAQPELTLPQAGAHIGIGDWSILHIDLPLKSTMALRDGPSFAAEFTSLAADYRIDPGAYFRAGRNPVHGGDLVATGFRLDSANTNFTLFSISSLISHASFDQSAGAGKTAFSVQEQIGGMALSPIFVTLAHMPFNGKVSSVSVDLRLSGPVPANLQAVSQRVGAAAEAAPRNPQALLRAAAPAIQAWAKQGGHGGFSLGLGLGPAVAHAAGSFGFDHSLQPRGQADVEANSLGEFLADIASAYPSMIGQISAITAGLQPYMVKSANGAQQLKAKLVLAKGRLTANGGQIAQVPPVDWAKLAASPP